MSYVAEKIEDLRAETKKLAALAAEVTRKPIMDAWDRRHFEEYLELIEEIDDYAARLQRPGEKWLEKLNG
jgi:hypothetical protein